MPDDMSEKEEYSLGEIVAETEPDQISVSGLIPTKFGISTEVIKEFFDVEYKNLKVSRADAQRIAKNLHSLRVGQSSGIRLTCQGKHCYYKAACELYNTKIGEAVAVKDPNTGQVEYIQQTLAPEGKPCHPPGELIKTKHHGDVPIELLDPSIHKLYGYERKYNAIRGARPFKFKVHTNSYQGTLIHVIAGTKSHRVTHDHIAIARFNERALDKFCVYLMRKGDLWRIGKSKVLSYIQNRKNPDWSPKYYLPFILRANREKADSIWLLGTYNTNTEALLAEEYFSVTWQIGKAQFIDCKSRQRVKHNGLYKWVSTAQLDAHHKSLAKPEDHYRQLLSKHELDIEYPFWRRSGKPQDDIKYENGPYAVRPFFLRACNIISEIMDVPTFPDKPIPYQVGDKRIYIAEWVPVETNYERYAGPVYNLDVEKHKTYFAGGIATHNCPLETLVINDARQRYIAEFENDTDADPQTLQNYINDLCQIAMLEWRCNMLLGYDHAGVTEDVPGAVTSDGRIAYKKELNPILDFMERLQQRKTRILTELVKTPREKYKKEHALGKKSDDQLSRVQAARRAELKRVTGSRLPDTMELPEHVKENEEVN